MFTERKPLTWTHLSGQKVKVRKRPHSSNPENVCVERMSGSLEQFLRAIWGAVSQAAAFPLPPNKTYLETLMLCIFLSWHPWSSHELRPREFKGMLKFTHRVSSKAKNSWSVSRVWALTTSELKWNMKVLAAQSCQLFVTSWTVVHQAPLSIAFSRQEY